MKKWWLIERNGGLRRSGGSLREMCGSLRRSAGSLLRSGGRDSNSGLIAGSNPASLAMLISPEVVRGHCEILYSKIYDKRGEPKKSTIVKTVVEFKMHLFSTPYFYFKRSCVFFIMADIFFN